MQSNVHYGKQLASQALWSMLQTEQDRRQEEQKVLLIIKNQG